MPLTGDPQDVACMLLPAREVYRVLASSVIPVHAGTAADRVS